MPSLRHSLFRAGFSTVTALQADRWLKPLACGAGVILTFHHVRPEPPAAFAPNALLSVTPAYLDAVLTGLTARGFDLIGLDALPERLRDPTPRTPFAVLTFDDGYRDNAEHAAPILKRHGAPWTLFVTSDFASGEGRLWWIELERAIARLPRVRIDDEDLAIDVPARTAPEKSRAFDLVYRRLRAGPEKRLLAVIAALCRQAGFAPGGVARELCLTWEELREIAADPAVTIGAHTLSHPMLAKHQAEFAEREMAESQARIAAELGRPVTHLSFPVGDPTSAGPREFAMARRLGFATAVTTRPGHLFPGHAEHLHALPRISINGLHQTDAALASLLSGVPFLAWNRGRRLNVG